MTKREELETALAQSEDALADAVMGTAKVGVDRNAADAKLERARARCRRIRAALVNLDRSEGLTNLVQEGGANTNQLSALSRRGAAAIPPLAQKPGTGNARTHPPLLRQTIDLVCLTLAYLQYYFIDVNLQIVSLPSAIG